MAAAKHVVVLLRRPPQHPRTAQGLRSAVGYLTANLRVTVVLCGPAQALLAQEPCPAPPTLTRHLQTLRALGQTVAPQSAVDLGALLAKADVVIPW
jgi:hypothetical protein